MTRYSLAYPVLTTALLLILMVLPGCGDDDDPVAPPPAETYDVYVDRIRGDDNFAGTADAPLRTITAGLARADSGMTVKVMPGTYDLLIGEVFPLVIPAGVELLGDEENKGAGATPTLILGGGGLTVQYTVSPGEGAVLAGFTVTNPRTDTGQAYGVFLLEDKVTIRNCSVVDNASDQCCLGSAAVIIVGNSENHLIAHNVITDNDHIGIFFNSASPGTRIEYNEIRGNQIGVQGPFVMDPSEFDLGGGGNGSAGHNVISCNDEGDLFFFSDDFTAMRVFARDNFWDHRPPTLGGTRGFDLVIGYALVDTTGSLLAENPCP